MPNVLDPRLMEMVEHFNAGATEGERSVEVLVGLASLMDAAQQQAVTACGLHIRSAIGDVLTGVIKLEDVSTLAALPGVLRIEASSPVYREAGGTRRQLPTE